MKLTSEQLLAFNPWWNTSSWEGRDAHLVALVERSFTLPAPAVEQIELSEPAIHILRGPRQVGKSTDLKLLVKRALDGGTFSSTAVIYLAFDLLEGEPPAVIVETVTRAEELAGSPNSCLVLLDEITSIKHWQNGVKSLWDEGSLRSDIVVCTGSSAVDLKRGAVERLPGRRSVGRDFSVLPQSFANFARVLDATIPTAPKLSLAELFTRKGFAQLQEMQRYGPSLSRLLERYLTFGGLPAAVSEAAEGNLGPSPAVLRVVEDVYLRETQLGGATQPVAHALLERVTRSLGSKTNWLRIANELGEALHTAPGRTSVQNLIDRLAGAYLLLVTYFWRSDSHSTAPSKDKKLYFGDLLLHTAVIERTPGLVANLPALVENALALALYRNYEPEELRFEGFDSPTQLHVWQTRRSGEIDFVCGSRDRIAAVEIKYQNRVDLRSVAAIAKVFPGHPVLIATKSTLEHRDSYVLVPAALLLWALG